MAPEFEGVETFMTEVTQLLHKFIVTLILSLHFWSKEAGWDKLWHNKKSSEY